MEETTKDGSHSGKQRALRKTTELEQKKSTIHRRHVQIGTL